jgi:hypothetical protein
MLWNRASPWISVRALPADYDNFREGQLYESDKIEQAVDALTFAAGSAGFAFVDIRPRYTANRETHTIDVTFEVREGQRVYLDRIDIVGNTRTIDQVIRRELRLAEGDAYNRVLVDRSVTEVKRLNFFKTVEIEQVPTGQTDRTGLRVRVEEQPTGELSFGAGYSSLSYLQRFVFDAIKIDRSFVQQTAKGARPPMLRSMVSLARDNGMDVIADGAESESDVIELFQIGCAYGQGAIFGQNISPVEARKLMGASTDVAA